MDRETFRWRIPLAFVGVLALVFAAYANHFHNSFHFDDGHAITDNPYIRDLGNIPLFFKDATTFSTLPTNRSYRPLVTTSLAIDYRLGDGLKPLWFHISTFFWFLVQLGLMFLLFRRTLDLVRPEARANAWIALFAVALYSVHPAIAETVNYVIQRGDVYATLGVVAALVIYIAAPRARRYGLYLLPVVAALLSKPPAVVFPALLFVWIRLFDGAGWLAALRRTAPALLVTGALMWFTSAMTPSTYVAGATSAWGYLITQPAVLLGYFRKFFLPSGLSADSDHIVFTSVFDEDALYGFLFLIVLVAVAVWSARRSELRPVSFGLAWFLIASLPTSVFPLAEVENGHRMFFPFVGLTLAASWAGALALRQRKVPSVAVAAACLLLLAGFAWGAHRRNEVWATDDTLWHDVTLKSPRNGRGLMNYGLTLMAKGDNAGALDYFERALVYSPNYPVLEVNLGIAYGALGRAAEAQQHFERAIGMDPANAQTRYFYARWLGRAGHTPEAIAHLKVAIEQNPDYLWSRYELMQDYVNAGDADDLRAAAEATLARFPSDNTAAAYLRRAANVHPAAAPPGTPESYLDQSLALWKAGKFPEALAAAQQAVKLRPGYAEGWNNVAVAWSSLSQWDQAIRAAQQAIRLKPDFQLAKNNLARAQSQKAAHAK